MTDQASIARAREALEKIANPPAPHDDEEAVGYFARDVARAALDSLDTGEQGRVQLWRLKSDPTEVRIRRDDIRPDAREWEPVATSLPAEASGTSRLPADTGQSRVHELECELEQAHAINDAWRRELEIAAGLDPEEADELEIEGLIDAVQKAALPEQEVEEPRAAKMEQDGLSEGTARRHPAERPDQSNRPLAESVSEEGACTCYDQKNAAGTVRITRGCPIHGFEPERAELKETAEAFNSEAGNESGVELAEPERCPECGNLDSNFNVLQPCTNPWHLAGGRADGEGK